MKSVLLLLTLAALTGGKAFAQLELPKVGRVDGAWFKGNPYAADSSVHAYVIAQDTKASVTFTDGGTGAPELNSSTRRLVRILDQKALDYATVKLQVYAPKGEAHGQSIRNLVAYTYNFESGEVKISKLDDSQVFQTRLDEYLVETAFSLPDVRAGSVLDVSYDLRSSYITAPPRVFLQEDIPVQAAEYAFSNHPRLQYKATVFGHHPIENREESGVNLNGNAFIGRSVRMRTMGFSVRDAPAIGDEPYMTTANNYRAQVFFELRSYANASGSVVDYATDWETVAKQLRDAEGLKEAYKAGGPYRDWAASFTASAPDLEPAALRAEQLAWAVAEVGTKVRWNGYFGTYPSGRGKRVLDKGTGSVDEVNVLLIGLLRALGVEANPVYLNTRDRGRVFEHFADRKSLYSMIVGVGAAGEQLVLMDATNPTAQSGVIPSRNLNGDGLLVERKGHRFVPLQEGAYSQQGLAAHLKLGEDNYLSGTVQLALRDYAAFPYTQLEHGRLVLDVEAGDLLPGFILSDVEVQRGKGFSWTVQATVKSREPLPDVGSALALDPTGVSTWQKNPFANENRTFPIEFPHGMVETRQVNITLPAGRVATDLPAPITAVTPDQGCRYHSSITAAGNVLTLQSLLAIKQTYFAPEAYAGMRELFELVAERESGLIAVTAQ